VARLGIGGRTIVSIERHMHAAGRHRMEKEINILALVKGDERYVFLYDDQNRIETLRTLGRYAADPQLSFNWYDAAVLSKKIREMAYEVETERARGELSPPESRSARFSLRHEEDII
jgi:hypothetical protein